MSNTPYASETLAETIHALRDTRHTPMFTLKRQGVESQSFKYTVFFKGDQLERFSGDAMPSEAEFVARLDSRRKTAKVPVLEASEESLKAFAAKPDAAPAAVEPASAAPAPATYPPLEAPAR